MAGRKDDGNVYRLNDRYYVKKIDSCTCVRKEDDLYLLSCERSGYRILHKPYFAMPGHTHIAWTLNPYTKVGTDAAPVKEGKIKFEEYLGLFGNKEWTEY